MRSPRPAPRFSKSTVGGARPAPALGEHGDAILAELGIDEAERADLRAKGIVG
jgi:alpha-methylacyl-CoA racemase